jgi:3-dehydroquinate synthase
MGGDALGRIRHLKGLRQPLYALADHTVHTDDLTPQQVADEVSRGWRSLAGRLTYTADRLADPARALLAPASDGDDRACVVTTETARYPVYAGWEIVGRLGERLQAAGLNGAAYLVSDSNVHRRYGERVERVLTEAGFAVDAFVVAAGEASKTLESAARIYDWLTAGQAERGHPVVALGGGVIGDLAGFAAATYLRGLPLVQLPTSLLAMVDASIGGKVAVNQRQAKNLIGAFYQPRLVFADVSMLLTLPGRELTSGWAEVVKHALILDPVLLTTLEERADELRALQPDVTTQVVRRSMMLKAQVVGEDERETTGRRSILNYGHTVGHALEAAAGYGALLHGEAVALGMVAAAEIGRRLGLTPPPLVERQQALLARFGLIREARGIDIDRVLAAMSLDKKVVGKDVRWVLLEDVGQPVLRTDVPASLVRQVAGELLK